MKWNIKPTVDTRRWHTVFAWKPVTVGIQRVWFEKVYRRRIGGLANGEWMYGTEFDIIKGSGELVLPEGTSNSMPPTKLSTGMMRTNISQNTLEVYNGSKWVTA